MFPIPIEVIEHFDKHWPISAGQYVAVCAAIGFIGGLVIAYLGRS
jgi:hypothetical protein